MKLKNSYILLIAMALFLLISIGSACAADNGTSDAGILTDDGQDVTLGDDTPEKIETTVESENVKISEKDPVEIPVTVKDNASSVISVAKENLTVKEGNTTINFNYNNSKINISDKLTVGNHSIDITYLGNSIYKNSTKNIILSIFGNKTLNVPSSVGSDGKTVDIPVIITDGVDQYALNKDNLTLTVTYVNETGNETSEIIDVFTVENNTIKFALDLKYIGATVNVNYTDPKESKDVIIKYATLLNASDITLREEEDKNITVTVISNGNILNITEKDLKVIEGTKELKFKYSNETITITDSLARGNHKLTILYIGNNTYNETFKNIVLGVYGNLTMEVNPTKLDINSTKKGEVKVNVTNGINNTAFTADDISLNVTTKNGNNTTTINVKSFDVVNGTVIFELENGDFSSADLTITYNNTASKTITLSRIYNVKIEVLVNENEYLNGAFKFKLVDIDDNTASLKGKTLSLYTTGNIRAGFSGTADDENVVSFQTANLYEFDQESTSLEMKKLEVGKHLIELSTSDSIKSTKVSTNLTITKANINIKIEDFKEEYGTDKNVTITVTNKKDGSAVPGIILHLYMPQTSSKDYYFQTDSNGQSKVAVKSLVGGTYDITVNNNDTKNFNKAKTTGNITITPKKVVINTKSVTVRYNTGNTATIKITDKKTGKVVPNAIVLVYLYTGSKYKAYLFQANDKGVVKFSASLSIGKHKMVVKTADTRYEGTKVTKYITVKKASAKLKAPKVNTYYKGGKYFTVTLTNAKNNKAIYDAKINIKVFISKNRYYNYNGHTGANGQIKLSLDSLKPGSYKVVVSAGENKNYTAKQITSKIVIKKAPTKLTPKKLTAKKGAKKYFKVVVKNKKTKKVIAGVKIHLKVYTGKNYKIHTVKSNSKGIAKLNVKSLKVGTHKVVVSSANKYCVAKAVKSTIKITK
jgi:hypothetical protein